MSSARNKSLLYLSLLCLAYYVITEYGSLLSPYPAIAPNSPGTIYVEIVSGGASSVIPLDTSADLDKFADKYNITGMITNGLKVIYSDGSPVEYGRISGLRSISLGIPIGINSAGAPDLAALPGIGDKLAGRIIAYREESGPFDSVEEIQKVEGIGDKKLEAIKGLVSLD